MRLTRLALLLGTLLLAAGCGAKKVHTAHAPAPLPPMPSGSRTPAAAGPRDTTRATTTPTPPSLPAPPAHIPQIGDTEAGTASWYGEPYHGRRAADGEIYDMEQLTAAHRTLPFNTWVRVRNQQNGRIVEVRITDRGPFVGDRIIDLSRAAARAIEMLGPGLAPVELTIIKPPEIAAVEDLFGVQVGAFSDRSYAVRLHAQLLSRFGYARMVQRADSPGLWRVVVGGCGTLEQAQALTPQLRREFGTAYAVRVDGEPGLTPVCPDATTGSAPVETLNDAKDF